MLNFPVETSSCVGIDIVQYSVVYSWVIKYLNPVESLDFVYVNNYIKIY